MNKANKKNRDLKVKIAIALLLLTMFIIFVIVMLALAWLLYSWGGGIFLFVSFPVFLISAVLILLSYPLLKKFSFSNLVIANSGKFPLQIEKPIERRRKKSFPY